jgi:hypothetical protein
VQAFRQRTPAHSQLSPVHSICKNGIKNEKAENWGMDSAEASASLSFSSIALNGNGCRGARPGHWISQGQRKENKVSDEACLNLIYL